LRSRFVLAETRRGKSAIDHPYTNKRDNRDLNPTHQSIHGLSLPSLKARIAQGPIDQKNPEKSNQRNRNDIREIDSNHHVTGTGP
jgi:hypothetical protein